MKNSFIFLMAVLCLCVFSFSDVNAKTRKRSSKKNKKVELDSSDGLSGVALSYYEKAKTGDPLAQFELSYCFCRGIGTIKDEEKAKYWAWKSAVQHFPAAQYILFGIYNQATYDLTQDELLQFLEIACGQAEPLAKNGDAVAQYTLGVCYAYGWDDLFPSNVELAEYWLKKSALQGYVHAQTVLGECLGRYHDIFGFENKSKEAFYWLSKAAEQGDAEAQYDLAYFYFEGIEVSRNWDKFVELISLSAQQEYIYAKDTLDELDERLELFKKQQ